MNNLNPVPPNTQQLCFQTQSQNICLSVHYMNNSTVQNSIITQGPIGTSIGQSIGGSILSPIGLNSFGRTVGGSVGNFIGDLLGDTSSNFSSILQPNNIIIV